MNGKHTPMPNTDLLLRTYEGTYTAAANASADVTLTYNGSDSTQYVNSDWTPIGIVYFTTSASAACTCEISNISLTGARMVLKNTTSSAISSRKAYVSVMFARANRMI